MRPACHWLFSGCVKNFAQDSRLNEGETGEAETESQDPARSAAPKKEWLFMDITVNILDAFSEKYSRAILNNKVM